MAILNFYFASKIGTMRLLLKNGPLFILTSGDTDPKTLEFECRNGRKDCYVQKRELFSEEWPKYQKYFFVDFKQTLGTTITTN